MSTSEKEKILMNKYVKAYRNIFYLPMKVIGFVRFDIKNNEIVELLFSTLVYRAIILIVSNMGVGYLVYISTATKTYLNIPDGMALIYFSLYANSLLVNQTFVNRNSGLIILKETFKIDAHLGIKETKFLRDVEVYTSLALSIMILVTNIMIGIILYLQYNVNMTVHVIGSSYFFWLAFSYEDYCFLSLYAAFIALRARFLNVALAKIGGVKMQYLSNKSMLNLFLWRKSFNDLVVFDGSNDDYRIGFELVFNLLRKKQIFFSFPIGLGFITIVVGTFVASQTFIVRLKTGNKLDQEIIITGWVLLSWVFMILMSLFVELFQHQIEQTKLICACILLKPNKPEVYKLSKTILHLLERRGARFSVYNLYFFDTGIILRMASATLVYITVQLQLAFPKRPNSGTIYQFNITDGV